MPHNDTPRDGDAERLRKIKTVHSGSYECSPQFCDVMYLLHLLDARDAALREKDTEIARLRAAQPAPDATAVVEAVNAERQRCFTWAIGRVPRSRAARAIRDGDDPHAQSCPKDPSVCWRCGEPLHPGHFCADAAPPPDPAAAERAAIAAWTKTPACRKAIAGAIREAMGDGIVRTDDLGTMASDAFATAIERGEHAQPDASEGERDAS